MRAKIDAVEVAQVVRAASTIPGGKYPGSKPGLDHAGVAQCCSTGDELPVGVKSRRRCVPRCSGHGCDLWCGRAASLHRGGASQRPGSNPGSGIVAEICTGNLARPAVTWLNDCPERADATPHALTGVGEALARAVSQDGMHPLCCDLWADTISSSLRPLPHQFSYLSERPRPSETLYTQQGGAAQ